MLHKLMLVSSFIGDYDIYLMDEPLTALDVYSQKFVIDHINQMKSQGKTFVIATHMIHLAYQMADELLFLRNGQVTKVSNTFSTFDQFRLYLYNTLNTY